MPKTTRQAPPTRSKIKIFLAIIAIGVVLFLVKSFFFNNKKIITPNDEWQTRLPTIQPTMPNIPAPDPKSMNPSTSPAPGKKQTISTTPNQCNQTADNISQFFKNLEDKPYIKAYEIKEPLIDYINKITIKLLNNPPIVAAETDNLFTVLKNTAHFYRILGPKDLSLMKDIIANEYNDIEYIWAQIYQWSTIDKECATTNLPISLPIKKTYEYAVFFINTLGGQSYLFRRNSHLRVITRYYCLLLLNQAAQQSLNYHTIDLAYTLESVSEDIKNADSLEYQEQYIAALAQIKENPPR